jgi:hypothetical protein
MQIDLFFLNTQIAERSGFYLFLRDSSYGFQHIDAFIHRVNNRGHAHEVTAESENRSDLVHTAGEPNHGPCAAVPRLAAEVYHHLHLEQRPVHRLRRDQGADVLGRRRVQADEVLHRNRTAQRVELVRVVREKRRAERPWRELSAREEEKGEIKGHYMWSKIFSCFYAGCKQQAVCYCACKEGFVVACEMHGSTHLEENLNGVHSMKQMYRKVDGLTKNSQIKQLNDTMFYMRKTEENIGITVTQTIAAINRMQSMYQKYFKEKLDGLRKLLETLTKTEKELALPGFENWKSTTRTLMKHSDDVAVKIASASEKSITEFEKVLLLFQETTMRIDTAQKGTTNELYFFKPGTRTLCKYETETNELLESEINTETEQGSLAAICQVDGNKLFTSGGYGPYRDTTLLIDLDTKQAEILPSGRIRACASATLVNKSIYVFGGSCRKGNWDETDRFDLEHKNWTSLSNLPMPTSNTSVISYGKFLVVSSSSCNVFKYGITEDSFEILTAEVPASANNILLVDRGNLYLLVNRTLFRSYETNLYEWSVAEENIGECMRETTAKPVYRGRFAYFYANYVDKSVYRFDFDDFKLHTILDYS